MLHIIQHEHERCGIMDTPPHERGDEYDTPPHERGDEYDTPPHETCGFMDESDTPPHERGDEYDTSPCVMEEGVELWTPQERAAIIDKNRNRNGGTCAWHRLSLLIKGNITGQE